MRVAIIGAGVAGNFLACLLSRSGIECRVYDGRSAHEKPCGGGCTAKVLRRYPLFPAASIPKNQVFRIYYSSSGCSNICLHLHEPIWIYSRRELDGFLAETAARQGAEFVKARATSFLQEAGSWTVRDSTGAAGQFDFLAGADGATSIVRKRLAEPFAPEDLSVTMGYYVPGSFHPDSIHIRFLDPELAGYLWAFPRVDHVSVGIINSYRAMTSDELSSRLRRFLRGIYEIEDPTDLQPYAAPVPTLRVSSLERLTVAGPNWALIGDAAGFPDPITAEGIYYAMRSAETLAQSLTAGEPGRYETAWRTDFGSDLLQAARVKDFFYRGRLLGDSFINRTLSLTRQSPLVAKAQSDLIAGRISYRGLMTRLVLNTPRILWQALSRKGVPAPT